MAVDAVKYQSDWGRRADYELGGYDASVPDLIAHSAWSTGTLALGNSGDQVLLLGPNDAIIDAAQWLTTTLAGVPPYTGTLGANHTLQRWPPAGDSDNCAVDFRDQSVPSPGPCHNPPPRTATPPRLAPRWGAPFSEMLHWPERNARTMNRRRTSKGEIGGDSLRPGPEKSECGCRGRWPRKGRM